MSRWDDLLPLRLPEEARGLCLIASISTGKDSTAMALALKESELPHMLVMADTEWESEVIPAYRKLLEEKLGQKIYVVGKPGGMPSQLAKGRMPSRKARWCTEELKVKPLHAFHEKIRETEGDTVCVIGIRRDEATSFNTRGSDPEWEWEDDWWGGPFWRPILQWTTQDVVEMHARHDVPINPLYWRGHDRVGCYPCVLASKQEIRLVAKHEPRRIDQIEKYETQGSERRRKKNAGAKASGQKQPYKHEDATFFQTERQGFAGIREVVKWSKTKRGGRQYMLLPPSGGGCLRWGFCEVPRKGADDEGAD